MRNTNKKGFTIVELVIVIAVIAILAAVLIPTFAGIIDRANQSADQQAVTNMNKLLAMNEKADDVDGVVEILVKEGYKGDLSTYFKGYTLAWLESENVIVLLQNNAVVFPEAYAGATGAVVINPMATDADALVGGLVDGKVVFVGGDITADGLAPEAAGEYEVNLNGNTLNSSASVGSWIADSKLVLSDGIVNSTNDRTGVLAKVGGYVELNNVQVLSASAANTLQCYGATMVLNNVTAFQHGVNEENWYNSALQVINTIKQVEQADGSMKWTIYGEQANTIVNSGNYTGKIAVQISAPGGNVTINGGNFTGTQYVLQDDFAPGNYAVEGDKEYESVITINGGNFTGAIKISAATELVINGGTFSIDPSTITKGTVTINGTVVDNGNGTWTVTK